MTIISGQGWGGEYKKEAREMAYQVKYLSHKCEKWVLDV